MLQLALLYSVVLSATRRITRTDLTAVAHHAGLAVFGTALSTGNLILDTDLDEAALERRLEAATIAVLGKPIAVFVRSEPDLHALIAANPFPVQTSADPSRVAIRVMRYPLTQTSLDRIAAKRRPDQGFVAQPRALWLSLPEGPASSPLLTAASAPWAGPGAFRNASALTRIAAVMS